MKIAIAGIEYVGISTVYCWSKILKVVGLDIVPEKIGMLNNKPITKFFDGIKEFVEWCKGFHK